MDWQVSRFPRLTHLEMNLFVPSEFDFRHFGGVTVGAARGRKRDTRVTGARADAVTGGASPEHGPPAHSKARRRGP